MWNFESVIYFLLNPIIIISLLLFKKDIVEKSGSLGIKQEWDCKYILLIVSCISLFQLLTTILGQYKIVTYYHLYIYGTFALIFFIGGLLFWIVKCKYNANFVDLGLSNNKLITNVGIGIFAFTLYESIRMGIIFLLDIKYSYFSIAQPFIKMKLNQMPLVDTFIFISTLAILAPFVEECLFRGIMYGSFKRKIGEAGSICLTSIIWSITHIPNKAFLNYFIMGVFLCYIFKRTNSLIPGIVIHCMINISSLLAYVYILVIK